MWLCWAKTGLLLTSSSSQPRGTLVCENVVQSFSVKRRARQHGSFSEQRTQKFQPSLKRSQMQRNLFRDGFSHLKCSYTTGNDAKSFGSTKLDDRVLGSVESSEGRVTAADVASQSGIELSAAQKSLVALANVVGGHLEVSRDGEIVYVFPANVRRVLLRESVVFALRGRWKKLAPGLYYLLRISFGIMLLVSIFIIYTSIIAISSSIQSRDEDRRGVHSRSYGGSNFYVWMGPSPFDLIFYSDRGYGRQKQKGEMSFLESIFSFLFGDGNPNAELETFRWQRIGEAIRLCGGAVTAEQIAPFLDLPNPPKSHDAISVDESFMLPVLEKFGGRPEVTDDGDIVYIFPDMLITATATGSAAATTVDGRATPDLGYIEEKEYVFSKASSGQILGAAGLGVLNLLGAVTLGEYMAQLRTVPIPFLKWAFPPLLGYALAFILIPVLRWYRQRQENSLIRKRNEARLAWHQLLHSRNPNVLRKLEKARRMRASLKKIYADNIAYTTAKSLIEQNQDIFDDFDKRLH